MTEKTTTTTTPRRRRRSVAGERTSKTADNDDENVGVNEGEEDDQDDDRPDDDHVDDNDESSARLVTATAIWFVDKIAVFGSSSSSLMVSVILLAVSIGFMMSLDDSSAGTEVASVGEIWLLTNIISPVFNWWSDLTIRYQTYKQLGPKPYVGPAIIYEIALNNKDSHDATATTTPTNIITDEMRERYEEDGVIAIRGLLEADLLSRIVAESERLVDVQRNANELKASKKPKVLSGRPPQPKQFFMTKQGVIFSSFDNENSKVGEDDSNRDETTKNDDEKNEHNATLSTNRHSAFLEVAMMSAIPKVASMLLGLENDQSCTSKNVTVRLMRDIFLAKDEEEYICGFHVDDVGFWPALSNAAGVNAWVALDDMPIENGGGFALAVGSHTASWKDEAYTITGSTHTYPDGGFQSSRDIFINRPGNGTCNIESSAPHLHRRMEETMRVYDIRRGDVIFHTRWLFHRTIPLDRSFVEQRKLAGESTSLVYKRYSIRYSPGSAIIPPGYGVEPSVLSNADNGGRSADAVSTEDAPWYPKVWPYVDGNELQQMEVLARDRFPAAMAKAEDRRRIIRPRRNRQH